MRRKIEWKWEMLDESTRRAKVMGGWIVQSHLLKNSTAKVSMSESMIFISDRDHEWHILEPIKEF